MTGRLPFWLIKKSCREQSRFSKSGIDIHNVKTILRKYGLNTVCESARCPNITECFSRPAATFMILGSVCTRGCGFCSVEKITHFAKGGSSGSKGYPVLPSDDEPLRVAEASLKMGLRHVVITSVSRDDLPDKGAGQFANTIDAIRMLYMSTPPASPPLQGRVWGGKDYTCPTIEVLTPDFAGSFELIKKVAESMPEIYNHNIETVPRLYRKVRPRADYNRSLNLLRMVKEFYPDIITKSGIMVGLGEEKDEVIGVMKDLRSVGCDVLTIGQYLMPTKKNLPVIEYVELDVFDYYKQEGEKMGFKSVESGPFVRSSYNARMI